jgi:hypothetical protein
MTRDSARELHAQAPHIIVISGLPGSGKSTISTLLAQRLGRCAHVEADALQALIVAGDQQPTFQGTSDEAARQLQLRLANACLLARSFVEAGFFAIIDEIIHGARFHELSKALDGVPFSFVMLNRDYQELRSTWQAMGSPFVDSWEWVSEEIEHQTPRVGLWINNAEMSAEETVERILQYLGRS